MRHQKAGLKLNRTSSHRKAMFRNMVTSLFKHQQIRTTDAKAKELRRWADHIITLAKRGDLHARRQALAIIPEKQIVHKLFEDASQQFGSRTGGYTRIVKIGIRKGDAAPLSLVELIVEEESKKKKATKKKTKAVAPKTPAKDKAEPPGAKPTQAVAAEADTDKTSKSEDDKKADTESVSETASTQDEKK